MRGWSTTAEFRGGIVSGRLDLRKRLRWSWRPGCPVDPARLRMLRVDYWGFDRRVHHGELVVHRDHARRILAVTEKLFDAHYPIQRMRLVDAYRGDDDRSMAANNTSGFNCRPVAGTSRWSEHAFGRATKAPVVLERDLDAQIAAEVRHLLVRLDRRVHQRDDVEIARITVAAPGNGIRANRGTERLR